MEREEAEKIVQKIKAKIEHLRTTQETYSSWFISLTDETDSYVEAESLKMYIKSRLHREYLKNEESNYATAINIVVKNMNRIEVSLKNDPLYIGGRYRKNIRGISNTPITFNREKRKVKEKAKKSETEEGDSGEGRLEEEFERTEIRLPAVSDWCIPIVQHFRGRDSNFMSSGREDIDVRMLGMGRPFVLKIENPEKNLPRGVRTLQAVKTESAQELLEEDTELDAVEIPYSRSRSVELLDLAVVKEKEIKEALKKIEDSKKKEYFLKVFVKRPPEYVRAMLKESGWEEKDSRYRKEKIDLEQKTPIRVMQRRANLLRNRSIYNCILEITGEYLEDGEHAGEEAAKGTNMSLSLCADAGTYIKEFANGDMGRTTPSLSGMLKAYCDVFELDVTGIDVEFPPKNTVITRVELVRMPEESHSSEEIE